MEKRQDQEIEKILDVVCACRDDDEDVCEICGGTGEVYVMEQVYPNEPHMAPIGTAPCECQRRDDDDFDNRDDQE